ncbi:DUF4279 domain-containing protein [Paraburkholderia caballeronis]|uniref:DUF4279 domain-containing protein n=1 Tax=Paraburkholderia caballeronis TaxID=416943 RepID=A0A1H7KQK1_9BURK|nr:DUF4279 domain-containing protein [Paraburkholderia caballeronis]PXW28121.1 uncharacterized protein DUF4279 [Paraburkholderia caballeronis]PXX03487.1 uncharacterized protein DUF4279 [Paraburkholderia caballeronis]RAK04231.1 uncharacterized protein DUF4279 [Paraburkholderia caballeronis]TDV19274.1 uncharacterized protein DUF4279 [Paraburkholderia caballeronis]TDV21874.1 uncharacterized protein DUF4279 [Paraburkholderia caballeronis]
MIGRTKTGTKKDDQLANATIYISGDSIAPAFWSGYFGIEPDIAITKGQPFVTPAGRLSRVPGRLGLWGVGSKTAVHSGSLEPHLRYLVERLGLPRSDLRDLLQEQGAKLALWCYWMNDAGDRVPDVPSDIRAMIEMMGGTIEIDEYK